MDLILDKGLNEGDYNNHNIGCYSLPPLKKSRPEIYERGGT
jgi:hypothetical protein